MKWAVQIGFLALLVTVAAGCGRKHNVTRNTPPPPPIPASKAKPTPAGMPSSGSTPSRADNASPGLAPTIDELFGYASWYGHPYHGRKTASGEIYDMNQLTAAHKTLPLGSRVQVINQDNGRQVDVRINDRGPFIEGRVIDLSYAAAKEIQMVGPGLALVRLNLLESPSTCVGSPTTRFGVQVGAFREKDNAARLQDRIAKKHAPVTVWQAGDLFKVLVGAEISEAAAQSLASVLRKDHLFGKVVMLP